ncbi:MAG: PAS domain S-box protein [Methylococcales bacterium]
MRPKILIVDSNPQNLRTIQAILEDLDAELQEASNGYDALSITQIDDFALILIDIQLPDRDGFEVCKQLRNNQRTAQTPVILIAADYKDNADKIRGYAAGANDCLCQPIDGLILKAKVQVFLRLFHQQYALQQADAELRIAAIAFNSQAGMVITDPKATILRVNAAFSRITGYTSQEAIGQTPAILKSGRHDPAFYSQLWKTLEEQHYWQGEIWNRRKNGEVYPEGLTITAVMDEDNQTTHYVAVFTDITERKRYEMQIRENEQHLLDILNVSPIAVKIATHQGSRAVFYNQRYADLVNNAHAIGKDPKSYYANTEDYQEIQAEIARGNVILNRQIELRTPEGLTVWALASYMPTKYHGEEAMLGWFFDITERIEAQRALSRQLKQQRQMEDALRIANEELRAIFDAALSGIALITDRIILRCNRRLEEIFGYGPGELDGEPIRLWFPDEAAYIVCGSSMCKEIAEGKYLCCEHRLIRKDKSLFQARISGQALESKDPSRGVVLIIEDITTEKDRTKF